MIWAYSGTEKALRRPIFTIYFFIGISIYKDFGISFDENINRINGFVWLKYLFVKLGINIDLSLFVNNLPNLV